MRLGELVLIGDLEPGFERLHNLEFYVLVGVTGVGKSTTLEALKSAGLEFSLLPDRRDVTDAVIFRGEKITDREARFARTAAFRQTNPGGMAQALETIGVKAKPPILFDGLRGLNEVEHAARVFPKARFIALDAPDQVRVRRLLGRGDVFDKVVSAGQTQGSPLRELKGIENVFTSEQIAQLEAMEVESSELEAKVKIVVTERQSYDPKAANAFLQALDSSRVLYVDTTLDPPNLIAERIKTWMGL
jgi:energy-coupling factor transporter ATP-binding protein EcfA2